MTTIKQLTPPGTAAIAVLEIAGSKAWEIVRDLFHRHNQSPLPDRPVLNRIWFGSLTDEVILVVRAIEPVPILEIHTHGGRQVIESLFAQFTSCGCTPIHNKPSPLQQALTTRTASILLDQELGAYDRAIRQISEGALSEGALKQTIDRLVSLIPVGRHLVEPWKVVVAGAPNAGKSSLVNAIAGFERSIVSAIPGTTRDIVTTLVALDGWPVDLADTAGLRHAIDTLEIEGIARAKRFLQHADLVIWLLDGTEREPVMPNIENPLIVVNKVDQPVVFDAPSDSLRISARTGLGIPELIAAMIRRLVPVVPEPGEAVPTTPEQIDEVLSYQRDPNRMALLTIDVDQ